MNTDVRRWWWFFGAILETMLDGALKVCPAIAHLSLTGAKAWMGTFGRALRFANHES